MPPTDLTLTLRLYDPAEKLDSAKAASWATISVSRADLSLSAAAFLAKYVTPNLGKLKQLKLS